MDSEVVTNIAIERVFFRRLAPFLDDPKRIVLMGNWNAILDPKKNKAGGKAKESRRCESSLTDFVARYDLVDRFRLDHPGMEICTWQVSSPSVRVRSYLDSVWVRRADIDFVTCPKFHYVVQTC